MSDQDTMFPNGDKQENKDAPSQDQLLNTILDSVKREDGTRKYSSLEEYLKGAQNAQEHIKTLTSELQSIKEGKDKAALEKILEKLQPPAAPAPVTPAAPEVKLDDVEKAVELITAKKQAKANVDLIRSDLISAAGGEDAAAKLFEERAESIGLSVKDLTALSAKSPEAVRKLLGLEPQKAPVKTPGSTVAPTPTPAPSPRIMLGGATTEQMVAAFRKHKPQ